MDIVTKGVAVVLGLTLIVFIAPLLGAAGGYFSGWVVAMVFTETTPKVLEFTGLQNFELKEIGAVLGFIGMFFRSSNTNNSK